MECASSSSFVDAGPNVYINDALRVISCVSSVCISCPIIINCVALGLFFIACHIVRQGVSSNGPHVSLSFASSDVDDDEEDEMYIIFPNGGKR